MSLSRTKFVLIFLVLAFAFIFITNAIFNQPPDSFFGSEGGWRSLAAAIVSPIKILLIGPLIPFINFLHQDPDTPPPFFLAGFAVYWTLLALAIHYVISRKRRARN